jgi:hypothetical protein
VHMGVVLDERRERACGLSGGLGATLPGDDADAGSASALVLN